MNFEVNTFQLSDYFLLLCTFLKNEAKLIEIKHISADPEQIF